MPVLIHNVGHYFYEKKRDLLILELKTPSNIIFDRKDLITEQIGNEQVQWFKDRGIDSFMTVSEDIICGWLGHYYIDVDPYAPIVSEYSSVFEDAEGQSLKPDRYRMIIVSYNDWVDSGNLKQYEQYLKDVASGNYNI